MNWLIPLAAFALFALAVYALFLRKPRTPNGTPDGLTGGAASVEEPPAKEAPVMQASVTRAPVQSSPRPRKPRAR